MDFINDKNSQVLKFEGISHPHMQDMIFRVGLVSVLMP